MRYHGAVEQNIGYRAADRGEVGWLTDVFVTSLRDVITEIRGSWDEARERDQFTHQLRLPDTCIMVAQGEPAGFYTAWLAGDHWFLGTLCVTPEQQNRGIGAAAMREIARKAAGLPVHLSVLKSNHAARRFYERLGARYASSTQYHDHFVCKVPSALVLTDQSP